MSSESDEDNELVVTAAKGQSSQIGSQLPPAYTHEHHQQATFVEDPGNINYAYNDDTDRGGNNLQQIQNKGD